MAVIHHHKLVRDKIPEIIEASGKKCEWEVLHQEAFLERLDAKLNEELNEYQQDKSMEELADLLEVMMAVAGARGFSWRDVEQIRRKKAEARGGFDRRILLKNVSDD